MRTCYSSKAIAIPQNLIQYQHIIFANYCTQYDCGYMYIVLTNEPHMQAASTYQDNEESYALCSLLQTNNSGLCWCCFLKSSIYANRRSWMEMRKQSEKQAKQSLAGPSINVILVRRPNNYGRYTETLGASTPEKGIWIQELSSAHSKD